MMKSYLSILPLALVAIACGEPQQKTAAEPVEEVGHARLSLNVPVTAGTITTTGGAGDEVTVVREADGDCSNGIQGDPVDDFEVTEPTGPDQMSLSFSLNGGDCSADGGLGNALTYCAFLGDDTVDDGEADWTVSYDADGVAGAPYTWVAFGPGQVMNTTSPYPLQFSVCTGQTTDVDDFTFEAISDAEVIQAGVATLGVSISLNGCALMDDPDGGVTQGCSNVWAEDSSLCVEINGADASCEDTCSSNSECIGYCGATDGLCHRDIADLPNDQGVCRCP